MTHQCALFTWAWRALCCLYLQVRIWQLRQLLAHPEHWIGRSELTGAVLERRLMQLRLRLWALESLS